jgi:hypothetical protein
MWSNDWLFFAISRLRLKMWKFTRSRRGDKNYSQSE